MKELDLSLESDRLRLRSLSEADVPFLAPFFESPEQHPYYLPEVLAPLNEEQCRRFLNEWNDGESYLAFGIWLKEEEQLVGLLNFDAIDYRSGHTLLGIAITEPEARGCGLAAEAVKLALAYAFGELRLHRVQIEYMEGNDASQRLFEGLGFTYEGCRRELTRRGSAWLDMHIMSMLSHEFYNH